VQTWCMVSSRKGTQLSGCGLVGSNPSRRDRASQRRPQRGRPRRCRSGGRRRHRRLTTVRNVTFAAARLVHGLAREDASQPESFRVTEARDRCVQRVWLPASIAAGCRRGFELERHILSKWLSQFRAMVISSTRVGSSRQAASQWVGTRSASRRRPCDPSDSLRLPATRRAGQLTLPPMAKME
jgi:hypothetical protein